MTDCQIIVLLDATPATLLKLDMEGAVSGFETGSLTTTTRFCLFSFARMRLLVHKENSRLISNGKNVQSYGLYMSG
jgi:hypothetical protein